jgi:ABC-type bacteriocin/lantibiotic exporter with double-glycine peptidase domain
VTLVKQRAHGDCGISALAMIARQSYEDAYVEVAKVDRKWRGKCGLYNREMVVIARRLGVRLQPTRRMDLDLDDGILRIRANHPSSPLNEHGHFVVLVAGDIRCPLKHVRMPWRLYLARVDARACTLLKVSA